MSTFTQDESDAACSPRNAAAVMNVSDARKRRASLRRRAADETA